MGHELVLIVDDNEMNVKLARDVLRFAGFRTLEAGTGGAGVSLAIEHLPDVILREDSGRGADLVRDEGRPRAVPGRRLRRLHGEADQRS